MAAQVKTCLVTGATSGIGLAASLELARRGCRVVLGCRDRARGQEAEAVIREAVPGAVVELFEADFASLASVRRAAASFLDRGGRLDVLLNNAGVWTRARRLSKDGLELTFAVNHLAPFLLTRLLWGRLAESAPSRIVNVSSGLHRGARILFDDLQLEKGFGGQAAYGQSKLANVLFTRELAKRLPPGVTANAVHPGVIATGLTRGLPWPVRAMARVIFASPETGAKPLVRLALDADVEGVTGRYFNKLKQEKADPPAYDAAACERLWKLSSELVGLSEAVA